MDPRIEKFADVLVNYSVEAKAGQHVYIFGSTATEPLTKAVYQKVLETGAHPWSVIGFPDTEDLFYKYANEDQLNYLHPLAMWIIEHADCLIAIRGTNNTKSLSEVPGEKIQMASRAGLPRMKKFMERSASGDLKWVVCCPPTPAAAMDAEMSLLDYEDFVYGAVGALTDDPIAHWKSFSKMQETYCDYLNGKDTIEIIGPNVDLKCSVEGRTWINCDGHFNMPDGEVFTGPVEDSMEGWVKFTYPAIYNSVEVNGVRLEFKKGKVIAATAESREEHLLSTIDTDEMSRYVGELAIGTNPFIRKFTKSILYDEKIAKSFHMALGSGYPETGSKLEDAAIHWDMICDMSEGDIRADGELFYVNGEFLI
jgi:aminopeptidase